MNDDRIHKRIVFRHMEHSDVLEHYANEQLAKIEDFLQNERTPIFIDLVMEPSKVHAHNRIVLRVTTPHYERVSDFEGADFYDTLDRVLDVMYQGLQEAKKDRVDHRKIIGRHDDFKKQR